jgi:hypothetical protein
MHNGGFSYICVVIRQDFYIYILYACVEERERQRQRERDRDRERETETEREREEVYNE